MNVGTLERLVSYEEERGKPMPSYNHSVAQANLIVEFAKNRDFRISSELTLEFGGTNYTPDLSIYPQQPVDWRHDAVRRTDPPLAVVEIFSPMQSQQSIMDKVEIYFRSGI